MSQATSPALQADIIFSRRDIVCFVFAVIVHSLLFLWQGGLLDLQQEGTGDLGEMLVSVNMLSEMPGSGYPGPDTKPGTGPGSFMSKVKSFFKSEPKGPESNEGPLAMGDQKAVSVEKPAWTKSETKLSDKIYSDKKAFDAIMGQNAVDISKGADKNLPVAAANSKEVSEKDLAHLKEKSFRVASKDVPFQIVKPSNLDTLSNVNAVPVNVGSKTSGSVQTIGGNESVGSALKTKSFSEGGTGSNSFAGSTGGSAGEQGGGLGLATGAGSGSGSGGISQGTGAGGSGNTAGAGGTGNGSGNGGGGTGYGATGQGNGGGRAWGGGGTGGTAMASLPRNTVIDQPAQSKSNLTNNTNSEFSITGALAGRPIVSRVKPAYEKDWEGRVALKFRVDWAGKVLDGIIVVISSGSPTFDQRVMSALKQWVFAQLADNRTHEIQEGIITFLFKGI